MFLAASAFAQCDLIHLEADSYLYTQTRFGQSFVACHSGPLKELHAFTHHYLDGDIDAEVSIRSGEGMEGEIVFQKEVVLTDEWGGLMSIILSEEVLLEAGQTYTLVIDYLGEYGVVWAKFNESYTEGSLYWNDESTDGVDLAFAVHIDAGDQACLIWRGEANQNWHDAANWQPQQIPGAGDCVWIESTTAEQFPIISAEAEVGEVLIGEGASLGITASGQLAVYKHLDHQGSGDFRGPVIMRHTDEIPQISGNPTFDQLHIEGLFYTTEHIVVNDVLDLSDGYMVNPGSELYLNLSQEHKGHLYMPEDAIAGDIIYKKALSEGYQLIGTPYSNTDFNKIMLDNGLLGLAAFEHEHGFSNFQANWAPFVDAEGKGVLDAVCIENEASHILTSGQTTNEDISLSAEQPPFSEGEFRLISNPYPSHIDWSNTVYSDGAPAAIYEWNAEAQQFGAVVAGRSTHGADHDLAPTDAIIVHLMEDEPIDISYKQTAVEPADLDASHSFEVQGGQSIELRLIAENDHYDEHSIRFENNSSTSFDIKADAYKIPSLNEVVPTIGSMSEEGKVLAIDTRPLVADGEIIPLYVHPGADGRLVFRPSLIDIQAGQALYLHDRKHDHFHDLIHSGDYQAEVKVTDQRDRFVLHFGERATTEPPTWAIETVYDEVTIRPRPEQPFILKNTVVTVHSLDGKLLIENRAAADLSSMRFPAHVTPGVYLITVSYNGQVHSDTFWLE